MPVTPESNSSLEPVDILRDARNAFEVYGQKAAVNLLDYADTTLNAEMRILRALKTSAEAYRYHGFTQVLRNAAEISGASPAVVSEIEQNSEKGSKQAALALIQTLRAEGFTTADINDVAGSLRQHNENARLVGQAEALLHISRSDHE